MSLEKTDQAISQSIQLFNDFAEKGIEFVQQQSPELCEQIVLRAEFQYITLFTIFLTISSILFFLAKKWQNYEKSIAEKNARQWKEYYFNDNDNDTFSTYSFTNFVKIVALGPAFIGCSICLYFFMSVYIAPKVYLVEYFTNLIK